jgi:pimeloyl-ACP methyl ester carboxylesterase
MPDAIVNDCTIHYEINDFTDPWRPAETIWIQHGWGRSSQFWNHWVPPLAGQYRVVRRDMRGHGQSSDPGPGYRWSIEGVLDDMVGFLDALGLERVHYIGESAGGVFGMAFAARYPDRLKSLTICSSPVILPKMDVDRLVSSLGCSSQRAALTDMPMSDFVKNAVARKSLTALGPAHLDWMIAEWRKNRTHVLCDLIDLFDTIDLTDHLERIAAPTLVLAPTQSPVVTLEAQRQMASRIPISKLVEIHGFGHEIYVDQADACIGAFKRFLAQIDRTYP